MNKVHLIGRLTANVELRYNNSNIAYTRFNLAVNRNFLNADGEREADFISCIAWRKTAELICEHFTKGSEFGLSGRIQTGNYQKDNGDKVYTTDVVVDEINFIGSKKKERPAPEYNGPIEEEKKEVNPFADFGEQMSLEDTNNDFLE